jgi:hypothetical protein
MSEYGQHQPPHKTPPLFSQDVAESKAARRKILDAAEKTRRENYLRFYAKLKAKPHSTS